MIKHPHFEILQDYFENALSTEQESLVKEHLLRCDQCTKMLADFMVIETRVRQAKVIEVSHTVRSKIFQDANVFLAEKRMKRQENQLSHDSRQLQLERMRKHLKDWKVFLYPELRKPALQLCSLSLVLATFMTIEKRASRVKLEYEPLTSKVSIFTYDEIIPKEEK